MADMPRPQAYIDLDQRDIEAVKKKIALEKDKREEEEAYRRLFKRWTR